MSPCNLYHVYCFMLPTVLPSLLPPRFILPLLLLFLLLRFQLLLLSNFHTSETSKLNVVVRCVPSCGTFSSPARIKFNVSMAPRKKIKMIRSIVLVKRIRTVVNCLLGQRW